MSTIDTAAFKEILEQERGRLQHAAGRLHAEDSESLDDSVGELGGRGTDNHIGDMASVTYDRELDQGLEEGAQQTLGQIDAALQRIEDGSYGLCEVCRTPIPADRLRAIPWTTRCIEHARR